MGATDKATLSEPTRGWDWLPRIGLLALLVWQGWMTLSLFGGESGWERLLDDEPILSGDHPLHQYHGYLGAQSLLQRGHWCCYDPAFQAGYPKTPVFDSGSRFAELFMLLAGGEFSPTAYKIGLAMLLWSIPLLVLTAARGVGLGWWETLVAVLLAQLAGWSAPARALLEQGEVDLLIAAVILLAELGLLIRYEREPGFLCWLGLWVLATLGWFAHPLLFGAIVPLFLLYYLSAGIRHGSLLWHVGLWSGQLAAVALNGLWLYDWVHHWWIRTPFVNGVALLNHRTLRTFWEAPLWGASADRALAVLLIGAALVGVILINQERRRRTAARLFGLTASALALLALLGISWEQAGRLGSTALLVPALWFMTVPAARALVQICRWLIVVPVQPVLRWAVLLAGAAVLALVNGEHLAAHLERAKGTVPLQIGLGAQQLQIVEMLKEHTDPNARILWEDRSSGREGTRWTALLPVLTGRAFVGGLDPEGRIAHSHAGFVHATLAGKALGHWSDAALDEYCRRYNIGWVVVWTGPVIERLRAWSGVEEIMDSSACAPGCLFRVQRSFSFALHGQAQVVEADGCRLVLANVVPKDGKVVLSFHYQTGLRATPSRVVVEGERDGLDLIPLMRLKVDGPVSRLVITWDEP